MSKERKSRDNYRTVKNFNGSQLNRIFEYTFGFKALKYHWDDSIKTFVFLADGKKFNNEDMLTAKEHFEKNFLCEVKFYS